jgi:2,4-dienoyl-CoA reductase-like NADH-dependent reductase (Old Yellow Enzyme family)
MSILFEEIKVGEISVKNRIVMSPLTRCRASAGRVPNKMMAQYYSQRASAGLIISEATIVNEFAGGYPDTPGIWNDNQVEGWKLITEAVHKKGGKIVCQLWHVGRVSDPVYTGGKPPVAPSAIAAKGHVSLIRPYRNYQVPHALEISEIKEIVNDFKKATENAKKADFDGVEIHGANGYLLDQFLQTSTNIRNDIYGGNLENRLRFPLEVVDAVVSVFGGQRVGYHMAPRCDSHSVGDENPKETFSKLMEELNKRNLAFVFSRSSSGEDNPNLYLKKIFKGKYIINQDYTKEIAEKEILEGHGDLVAFGKAFIPNPDLVERLKNDYPLTNLNVDKESYYVGGENGYITYPTYNKNNT